MAFFRLVALTGLVAAASAGIYPDGHFDVAVKINDEATFDTEVQAAVDGDHTLFIRWIASEG
jgi:hypothetical protein